jgi:hypothetical protein
MGVCLSIFITPNNEIVLRNNHMINKNGEYNEFK